MTPKQALEELEEKAKLLICNDDYVCDLVKPIYQALTDYEKQKQILEVLKEKRVDVDYIIDCKNVEEYNNWCFRNYKGERLTETEFNLLKEWLK